LSPGGDAGPHPLGVTTGPEVRDRRATKTRAASLSVVSNTLLVALKLTAGVLTGSIAILTEAIHSAIDLVASVIAAVSVRKAEVPADEGHPYGHAKVENLAAAAEGLLIVVGAGVIVFESVRRLADVPEIERIGLGVAVVALSGTVNLFVSSYLFRQAKLTGSPALEGDAAHLRTDAVTSFGVLAALVLVSVTGVDALDPIVAILVAGVIVHSGLRLLARSGRVLVDEALPADELAAVGEAVRSHGSGEVLGYHKLRARRAGSDRYVDLHVQFRRGTSLERAHELAHELTGEIRRRLGGADVLVHLEPEDAADRGPARPARDAVGGRRGQPGEGRSSGAPPGSGGSTPG
jgi:cation diffusion facilitator family transporter